MTEYSRRTLLRLGAASLVGVATGELAIPLKKATNNAIEYATGLSTGNAGTTQQIEAYCTDHEDKELCAKNFEFSANDKFMSIVIAPIIEETVFRALPSFLLSEAEGSNEPTTETLLGSGGYKLTRNEMITGLVTSLLFGFAHNITYDGVNTKMIPASQTLGGMVYFYLQRKLGILASVLAHSTNNYEAIY